MGEGRKIAAILAADVVGFSRMASADEDRTLARLRALRADVIDPIIASQNGRVFKRTGDGALVEFRSVVEAVRCAIAVQDAMAERNVGAPEDQAIVLRIGVHLGDVVEESDGDLMGDGVNIAARLEGIAKPGAICISEDAYRQVKGRLDLKVTDLGPTQLRNIAEPIRAYLLDVGKAADAKPTPASVREKSVPPRLSIVVLPFVNLGGGEEHEYFVDGVTESLTTDLSRIRGSFVIGRNTAFTFKNKAVDLKQVGRELNVRYVLEGSVQRGGSRMRISVQLIDAESGSHLWAERFDKPLADLFEMQDEIVARLAGALNAQLVVAEARRAELNLSPDSTDLYFQGLAWLNKGMTSEHLARATHFLGSALSIDPNNVDALVASARADTVRGTILFAADPVAPLVAAERKLAKALSLAPDHARGHRMLGIVYMFSKRAILGIAECEHALALDSNLAGAHGIIGMGKICIGRPEDTEAHVTEFLRLSPRDVEGYMWMNQAAWAKNLLGLHEQAAAWSRRAIEANRNYAMPYFNLGVALAQLGHLGEAHSEIEVGRTLAPAYTIAGYRLSIMSMAAEPRAVSQMEEFADCLRLAGIPE